MVISPTKSENIYEINIYLNKVVNKIILAST